MTPLLHGYQVVENTALVVPKLVERERWYRRTWKERLFSRPWRPLQWREKRLTTETEMVPDPNIYVRHGVIYCHPEVAARINEAIDRKLESQ